MTECNYLNNGGRYTPSSDSWTATSTGANCPSARVYHTAVWTGTQMIVWGGRNDAAIFNDGGIYSPSCAPPAAPTVLNSTNGVPLCCLVPLPAINFYCSTVAGATYAWTGPDVTHVTHVTCLTCHDTIDARRWRGRFAWAVCDLAREVLLVDLAAGLAAGAVGVWAATGCRAAAERGCDEEPPSRVSDTSMAPFTSPRGPTRRYWRRGQLGPVWNSRCPVSCSARMAGRCNLPHPARPTRRHRQHISAEGFYFSAGAPRVV